MSIQKVLDKIREQTKIATTEVEREPIQTYPTRSGMRRQAKESLNDLFIELKNVVRNNHLLMIGMGSGANRFGELIKDKATIVDLNELYTITLDQINEGSYIGRTPSVYMFDIINSAADIMFKEMDIIRYPLIEYKNEYFEKINDKEDMLKLLKRSINSSVGPEIMGHFIIYQTAKQLISENVSKVVVPIYVAIEDETLMNDAFTLANKDTFFIGVGNLNKDLKKKMNFSIMKLDEESILDVLSKIKEKMNK